MGNSPLMRAYFLGGVALGEAPLDSHDIWGFPKNGGTPQNIPKSSFLVGKPMVVG